MGGGANENVLSLSWQGAAGGDSEEVRFVVGIHFPWLSWGSCWLQQCERNTASLLYPGEHGPGCGQLRGGSVGQGKEMGCQIAGPTPQSSQPSCGWHSRQLYF